MNRLQEPGLAKPAHWADAQISHRRNMNDGTSRREPKAWSSADRKLLLRGRHRQLREQRTTTFPHHGWLMAESKEQIVLAIVRARAELEEALYELEKLPAVSQSCVSFAAHALNNFLTVTGGTVELL